MTEITYLTDVSLLTCVVQQGYGDAVLKAARDVGAITGAIGYDARGYGARERLGLLGVAVEAEKDVISILVSTDQQDAVFDSIYRACKLDVPGRGYMYLTPLDKVASYIPESVMARMQKSRTEDG